MQTERRRLWERRQAKLRKALGVVLACESAEELDRIGEVDQLRAERGLVPVIGQGSKIFYKHIDDLSRVDIHFRTAPERVEVAWLKARVERRKMGAAPPIIPYHLR